MINVTSFFTTYFPFLAGAGVLVGCWGQVKSFFINLYHLFVVEIELSGKAVSMMSVYISCKGKPILKGTPAYDTHFDYIKSEQKKKVVVVEQVSRTQSIFLLNKWPIFLTRTSKEEYDHKIKVSFLRYTFKTEDLLIKAYDFYYEKLLKNARFKVHQVTGSGNKTLLPGKDQKFSFNSPEEDGFRYFYGKSLKYSLDDIGYGDTNPKKCLENYVFCEQTLNLYKEVEKWKASQSWYADRNIPWRRGALLFGGPGTGKSSCIRTICQALDIPVWIFDLGSLNNQELIEKWQECQNDVPIVAVFEDIDNIYNKRELVKEDSGPSFDCILNCLSGILPCEGVFTFITTNNIDKLDESLGTPKNNISSRPGRMDMLIELGKMDDKDRYKLIEIIFKGKPQNIDELMKQTDGMTAAQCSEFLSRSALELFWNK